ncbi:DUF805 domain-containing protein [Tropicimonas marinistellae]|uniref:DUF805 domain-containing protein n=1 Tax=Tropicimonas marinistellae TaxID=1739787 RepID=UPI00082D46D8|nr:DUF805 domain-containing protein [Tropicimonas marinistellae]
MSAFTTAISTCLSKYVTFSGRARRPEYWWFVLFVVIGGILLSLVDGALFGADAETGVDRQPLSSLFSLAMFLPMLAAGWRRLHDTGRPGWYLLLPMVVSLAMVLAMMMGVMVFSAAEQAGSDPDALRAPALAFGIGGMIVAGILQLVLTVLMIWWLSRPTQEEQNQYGPVPPLQA